MCNQLKELDQLYYISGIELTAIHLVGGFGRTFGLTKSITQLVLYMEFYLKILVSFKDLAKP